MERFHALDQEYVSRFKLHCCNPTATSRCRARGAKMRPATNFELRLRSTTDSPHPVFQDCNSNAAHGIPALALETYPVHTLGPSHCGFLFRWI